MTASPSPVPPPSDSPPAPVLNDILAGLLVGIISVLSAISLAGLIFSGALSVYLPVGIGIMLLSNFLMRTVVALASSFPVAIANPQPSQVTVLALMSASIAAQLSGPQPDAVLSTVLAAIALGSLLTGATLLLLRPLKLDRVVRFIPYPIMGGFLGGIGCWLVEGGWQFMGGSSGLSLAAIVLTPAGWLRWVPGISLALAAIVAMKWARRPMLIPVLVLAVTGGFYLVLPGLNLSVAAAEAQGLLLGPFPSTGFWQSLAGVSLDQVQWTVMGGQVGSFVSLALLSALSVLLGAVGLEVVTEQEGHLERELTLVGIANCLNGLTGGVAGSFSLKSSVLAWQMGGRGRLVGLSAAAVFAVTLVGGIGWVGWVPRGVVGGILVYLGLNLLVEWVIESRHQMPRADYLTVLLITAIIATAGLIRGIGAGLVVSAIVFVWRYSQVATARRVLTGREHRSNVERTAQQSRWLQQHGDQISILELQGFLFFGTVNSLLERVKARSHAATQPSPQWVIFDFRLVTGLDASAVVIFSKLRQLAEREGLFLVLTTVAHDVWRLLESGSGLPRSPVVQRFPDLDRGLEWCENQLLATASFSVLPEESSTLRLSGIFTADRDDEYVSQFLAYLEKVNLAAGDYLFQQGEASDSLYFIASGQLDVLLDLPNGGTRRLRSLRRGSVLGEMGLYTQAPRSTSVQAATPSCLYQLNQAALAQMERDSPALTNTLHRFVIRALSERLQYFRPETSMLFPAPPEQENLSPQSAPPLAESVSDFPAMSALADFPDIAAGTSELSPLDGAGFTDTGDDPKDPTALSAVTASKLWDAFADISSPQSDGGSSEAAAAAPTASPKDKTMPPNLDHALLVECCRQELSVLIGPMADVVLEEVLMAQSAENRGDLVDAIAAAIPDANLAAQFRHNIRTA